MPSPEDDRHKKPDRDPPHSKQPGEPSRTVDHLGSLLYAELTNNLPLLSPTYAPVLENAVGSRYAKLREKLATDLANAQKDLADLCERTRRERCFEALRDHTLESVLFEQSDLRDVREFANLAALHAMDKKGLVISFVAEDFEDRLRGTVSGTHMHFLGTNCRFWPDTVSEEVVKKLLSSEISLEAGYKLPFSEGMLLVSTIHDHALAFGGMPNFEKLAGYQIFSHPLRYEETSLGALLAVRPKNCCFDPQLTRNLIYVSESLAKGIAHIKRLNDRAREGS